MVLLKRLNYLLRSYLLNMYKENEEGRILL